MRTEISRLPKLPGIYLFKHNNTILYIGKAKNIKKRVQQYFTNKHDNHKIQQLLDEHTHIDHIVTHTETEALLLEAQLIKDYQPKFNVLLKSGQPFVYLVFTNEQLPKLELVRNKKKKGNYFGPFLHKKQARSVFHYLATVFRLNFCKAKIANGCLAYHLGHCAGNCMNTFDKQDYLVRLSVAQQLLEGNYKKSLALLQTQIKEYMHNLDFEKAKNLYAYEQNLESIFQTLKVRYSERKYEKEIQQRTNPLYAQAAHYPQVSKLLQTTFGLSKTPTTIDCFDISHFQSKSIVGSCIRFTKGIPEKNKFRRFAIRTLQQQNDYAALQEIVTRRYKKGEDIPDLILIDGGKGQLNAVLPLLPNADIVSLAKQEECVFTKQLSEGIKLDIQTGIGQLLIALRDYAHHFAISYHRKKRRLSY